MNELKIYTCSFKDGDKEMIAQPFITTSDENAIITVKNAIRAEKTILSMALAERIKLFWICDINPDDFTVNNIDNSMHEIVNESYFRKYAQCVYADEARQKANEMEATNND